MPQSPALARPEIQAELIAEALVSASAGFLVWDEDRRYIAANSAACEILGTTLDRLLRRGTIDEALTDPAAGTVTVRRLDGSGPVDVFYATFATKAAGMPFMATLIVREPAAPRPG